MSPIIPYNVMNYFLGVTSTEFLNYLFGLIGFIPLVVCYVYLGTTIEDLSNYSFAKSQKNPYELVVMIISIVISVVCILIVTHMAKAELAPYGSWAPYGSYDEKGICSNIRYP